MVTSNVVSLEEYRRFRMTRRHSAARASGDVARVRGRGGDRERKKLPGTNRSIRLTDEMFAAWGFWCDQMGMSYDEAIRFFLDHHPVEIRVPKGVKVKPKTD